MGINHNDILFSPVLLKPIHHNYQIQMTNWREKKGKLKQKLALITDNKTLLREGKMDEVLGRLENKLGKSKKAIRKLISKL
jgi:uncharacterized protein YjbJ (UPF0337 family)